MGRSVMAMACGLMLVFGVGCGDELSDPPETGTDSSGLTTPTTEPDTSTTTSETTATTGTTTTTPAAPDPDAGPAGPLLATGVGDIKQGASVAEAIAAFGEPTGREQFSGCELDPRSGPIVQLSYPVGTGKLYLNFDAARDEFVSYRTDSPDLATALVDHVGEPFTSVRANWGAALQPLDLGEPSTPKGGAWFVEDSPESQLVFTIGGGTVRSISGGYLPPCE